MNEDLALQLASSEALIRELSRRSTAIVLLAQFRGIGGSTLHYAERAHWKGERYHELLGLCRDLESRIMLEMRQHQVEAASIAEAQEGRPPDDEDHRGDTG